MKQKKIVIINKEKIFSKNNNFYCDNVDLKSIPEGLAEDFDVSIIAVKSKLQRAHSINLKNVKIASNLLQFLFNIFKTFKHKDTNYLIISVTPYSFFAYLLLFFFRKNIYIYLRSNGYEEYKAILGVFGPLIYHIMYNVVTFRSKIISCQERLVKKKNYNLVFPSELDVNWMKDETKPLLDKPRLLYVGRIKIEKGIYSLIKILDEIDDDLSLSIAGKDEGNNINNKKINLLGFQQETLSLINTYDVHNITILPSFTEAHPKVVDESLARVRHVIIFDEINHIVKKKYGLFISKRNSKSLLETIKFIMNNYSDIQKDIKKNKLPTKKEFILDIKKILN